MQLGYGLDTFCYGGTGKGEVWYSNVSIAKEKYSAVMVMYRAVVRRLSMVQ